jgi:hypothetical protein
MNMVAEVLPPPIDASNVVDMAARAAAEERQEQGQGQMPVVQEDPVEQEVQEEVEPNVMGEVQLGLMGQGPELEMFE